MYYLLISLVIGLFVAMLFVNIYFRMKVLKSYRRLIQNRVDFSPKHVINRQKLEEEIIPKYPQHRDDIYDFVHHIHYSLRMATVLIALITLFGGILMYYR